MEPMLVLLPEVAFGIEVFATWGCPRSKEVLCRTAGGWLAGPGWLERDGKMGRTRAALVELSRPGRRGLDHWKLYIYIIYIRL